MAVHDDEVLAFIADYWETKKTAPTLTQMAQGIGLESPEKKKSFMLYTCERLCQAGKLEPVEVPSGTRRGWKVRDDGHEG